MSHHFDPEKELYTVIGKVLEVEPYNPPMVKKKEGLTWHKRIRVNPVAPVEIAGVVLEKGDDIESYDFEDVAGNKTEFEDGYKPKEGHIIGMLYHPITNKKPRRGCGYKYWFIGKTK